MNRQRKISVLIVISLIFSAIPFSFGAVDEWVTALVDEDLFYAANRFEGVDMIYLQGDESRIIGWYWFEGPVIQWGRHIVEAYLEVRTPSIGATDTDASMTIYGKPSGKGGTPSNAEDPSGINGPYTTNHYNVNLSSFVGPGDLHNITVTNILREINQGYYFWDGHDIALVTLSADSHDEERSISSLEAGYPAKLYVHYDAPEAGDPEYPPGLPDDPDVEWIEDYRNYTIWRYNATSANYTQSILIEGQAGAGTNYPVRIHVNYSAGVDSGEDVFVEGKSLEDFGDVSFKSSDGTTDLDYWLERRSAYVVNFTKLPTNPLADWGEGFWLTSFYSNYSGENRIHLIIQESAAPETDINMWSFTPEDANNFTAWTDHGVIIAGVETWEDYHREPHSVIFETQSMANARVGGTGIRSWRLYYCGIDNGLVGDGTNYRIGIATAPENDTTTWTRATALNPIYGPIGAYGVADPEAFIKDDEVWMAVALYNGGGTAQSEYYTVSTDGITGWVDRDDAELLDPSPVWGENFVHGDSQLISMLIGGTGGVNGFCTADGRSTYAYDRNPIIPWGTGGSWDDAGMATPTIPKGRNGTIAIDGIVYVFYMGMSAPGSGIQIGGAIGNAFDGDAYFWVEVEEDLGTNRTIYINYGDTGTTTTSNGTNTFTQFDEFSDLDDWTIDKDSGTETITIIDDTLVEIRHRLHTYAHIERSQVNDNVTIRIKGVVPDSVDSSWALSLGIWFNQYDWVSIAFREDQTLFRSQGNNDTTTFGIGTSGGATLTAKTYYWIRLRVGNYIYADYSADGISWTNIGWTSRPATWANLSMSIIGHGYEVSGVSYPNPDWDNSFLTPGVEIDVHADQYVARKYILTEPGADTWGEESNVTEDTWYVTDENGTIVWTGDNGFNETDIEDIIDEDVIGYPDPEDPNPPGWEDTGFITIFRFKLVLFSIAMILFIGTPIWGFATKPEVATWIVILFCMLCGVALLWSFQTM